MNKFYSNNSNCLLKQTLLTVLFKKPEHTNTQTNNKQNEQNKQTNKKVDFLLRTLIIRFNFQM